MISKIRKILLLITAAGMTAIFSMPCLASEPTQPDMEQYEEQLREMLEQGLDSTSEEPSQNPLPAVPAGMEAIVNPDLKMEYNGESRMFEYTIPDGSGFTVSVPNRMVTCDPVTFLPPENSHVTVTRNGSREDSSEDGYYSKPGRYHIRILKYPYDLGGGGRDTYLIDFYFHIIRGTVSAINLIHAPEGFRIEKLELDGKDMEMEQEEWEFLHEDGHYRLWFLDKSTGKIRIPLSFTRDTTAPFLTFTPPIDREEMKEPVSIVIDDPEAVMEVYYGGSPIKLQTNQIDIGGYYQFRVADQAGNERFYSVTLARDFRGPGKNGIIMTIIGIAALAGFLIYQRRHVRVL